MRAEATLPSVPALMRDFAERHHLTLTDLVHREKVGIKSTSAAFLLVNQSAQLDHRALSDPSVGLLLNLLHRNFEHVEAAITAFVSGCGPSAEVVARASVESSVNILYILAGEPVARLRAYFDCHLEEVDAQVRKWKAQLTELNENEAAMHQAAADQRLAASAEVRRVVDGVFGSARERWAKSINERFKCIGESLGYRTFYARMSSEAHGDAEETLRYFIGRMQSDETVLDAMALETVWTTRLYIYYAVSFFLRASLMYARTYALSKIENQLKSEIGAVERELVAISEHVGVGF